MATESSETLQTYHGTCHCNAFQFFIQIPELKTTTQCTCSFCFKRGYEWIYPVRNGILNVEKDEGKLSKYEFGGKTMGNYFCSICGTGVYSLKYSGDESERLGVNIRALKSPYIYLPDLEINTYDGGSIPPPYKPPVYTGLEPSAEIENAKISTGACHCGAVRVCLKTNGVEHEEPWENEGEGIGFMNGSILILPFSNQFCVQGAESLTSYMFGRRFESHEFCKVCGVSVCSKRLDVKQEEWDKYGKVNENLEERKSRCAVNLRCFEGVDWEYIKRKVKTYDEGFDHMKDR